MSKAGLPVEQIAADIWRHWRAGIVAWRHRAQRKLFELAAYALVIGALLFLALPGHLWREAKAWWRKARRGLGMRY